MSDAPQPVAAIPPDVVWHVGRTPDPWAWVPLQYAGRQRWDDFTDNFRTVYAASSRFGCYVEVLAHFRPDPDLVDEMAAIRVSEDDADRHPTYRAGEIDQDWAAARVVSAAHMGGVFCDVTQASTIAALRPRMIGLAPSLGLPDFDSAALKLAAPADGKPTGGTTTKWSNGSKHSGEGGKPHASTPASGRAPGGSTTPGHT